MTTPPLSESSDYCYFSQSEFTRLADIFLDFYCDGKYSVEGVEEGESTNNQRRSIKNDFKDHIYGDAKYRRDHSGGHKKWSKYTGCLLKTLINTDTKKIIDLNKKVREYKRKNEEQNNTIERTITSRIEEATKIIMEEARSTVDEELRERADRIEGRFKKYQETNKRYEEENKRLNEDLASCVSRSVFDEQTTTILDMKLQLEQARGSPKKMELTPAQIKKKEIKKKKKELKALMESINISSSDDESSSSED
tara:strand:+ start:1068 stop:1823 length:756 start_codon:yes stop_codon:yes gene_type:complete